METASLGLLENRFLVFGFLKIGLSSSEISPATANPDFGDSSSVQIGDLETGVFSTPNL